MTCSLLGQTKIVPNSSNGTRRLRPKLGGVNLFLQRFKMALFKIKNEYFNKLLLDDEFEKDAKRLYFIVRAITYKNEKIAVAIPLRSNINQNFQKNTDEYIATLPSYKTQIQKGNVAGWHITKMIPIDFRQCITVKSYGQDIQIAENIITNYKKEEFIKKVKKYVNRIESGEKPFGCIDFDNALNILKELNNR